MTIGDNDGLLYVTDYGAWRVLRVESDGSLTVLVSGIPFPTDVEVTANGRIFFTSTINQAVYEIVNGTAQLFAGTALSYATSIVEHDGNLYVSNPGNGTVVRIDMSGQVELLLSGYVGSLGPYGISVDKPGRMYFIQHGTGAVYCYDFKSASTVIATVTSLGGTFTSVAFRNRLFITDAELGLLLEVANNGTTTVITDSKAKTPG